jgi:rhodanese-related sulfurtransferase
MNRIILQVIVISFVAALLAVGNNLVNPNKVPWIGNWPSLSDNTDSVWVSPSYDAKSDPPTLRLSEAFDRFTSKTYLFVDAREPEEYQAGHIKDAINLPFDTFDDHWAQVESLLPKNAKIVTYCSGTECDASLLLARLLIQQHGYKNIEIFL